MKTEYAKALKICLPILGLVLLAWLKIGISNDTEFSEKHIFIKNGWTFKLYFYSPIGMSDMKLQDLSPEKQREEQDFRKHVPSQFW